MSTKKEASWTDVFVAESDLPADEFTWTDASNYGLDGFQHLQTMNEGVMNHGDQSGMSGPITPAQMASAGDIPADFFSDVAPSEAISMTDEVDGLDLAAMLSEDEGAIPLSAATRQAASLADLAWLDPTQEQDPDRLPKELLPDRPPLHSIPELENAWGVDRRTDGLTLIPNRDKAILDYEKSIDSPLPATPGNKGVSMKVALTRAVRRSTYGHSLRDIHAELVFHLGEDPAKAIIERVAQDHGLNGTVFIRASAFPGIRSGKWTKHIKRVARTARYVVTDDATVAMKLGLKMVSEVPWRKALRHYKGMLTASGYKLASGDPKQVLRRAFLMGPSKVEPKVSHKPKIVPLADTVTTADAKAAMKAAPKQARKVLTSDETAKARKKLIAQLSRSVKAGFISKQDALRLGKSTAAPHAIRRVAERLVRERLASKSGTYSGLGTKVTAHRQGLREASWSDLRQAELTEAAMKKAQQRIVKMVNTGMLTHKEARYALGYSSAAAITKAAAAIVQAAGQHRKVEMKARVQREFKGPLIGQAPMQRRASRKLTAADAVMHAAAKASGIKVADFKHLSTWLRQQMSEGLAGKDLTDLMRVRYASPLRTAASDFISALRTEHEGLSGHLYVDAMAYASTRGTKGCEKAAKTHRTNQIPLVKAMPRCGSCVFASGGHCNKYGKELMARLPEGASDYQRKMIQTADAPDHEITASLFNPQEFNLGGSMDHIALNGEVTVEELGDVLFGDGMTF